jgi:hypothetical protein
MFHENTGFDQNNNGQLREDARSIDPAVRAPAIAALSASASTFGPSLSEKNDIVKNFKTQGGDGTSTNIFAACGVCGSSDIKSYLSATTALFNQTWIDSSLRLNEAELISYVPSRVTGYTNISVLENHAVANGKSLLRVK